MIDNHGSDMTRILLLGGTTEASRMAHALADARANAVFSYAGRTGNPLPQPLPVRVGGFGGIAGMAEYLRAEGISHVVDATHPFAAAMSRNAVAACAETGAQLIAIERPPWRSVAGDNWVHTDDVSAAVAALPDVPKRVFLAIGRTQLHVFATAPQHHYLLRFIDDAVSPLPLPNATAVTARGPFKLEGELELMRAHDIEWLVTKNSGGEAARAKLDAARALGVPVIMVDRPRLPVRKSVETVAEAIEWLGLSHDPARLGV
jgi:precorrin-6A/cobalt-precorrin-6A reductase